MGCSSKERLKAAERFHLITEESKAQNTSQEPINTAKSKYQSNSIASMSCSYPTVNI